MVTRFYSSVAPETTLTSGVAPANTLIVVQSTSGLPVSFPYTLAVDYQTATEELVEVTAAAGNNLTVTRAIDGTSAASHNAGARVRHVSSARDFKDSRDHENTGTNVHGVGASSDVVGTNTTQTLANKTANMMTGTFSRIDIFNDDTGGAWVTTINGDTGTPGSDLLRLHPDSGSNQVATVNSEGAYIARNKAATDASKTTYKFRATKSNGTEEIFYVVSGGQVVSFLDSGGGAGAVGFTCVPADDTTRVPMFQGLSPSEVRRTAIYQDGTVEIVNSVTTSQIVERIRGVAGQTANLTEWQNSAGTSQAFVSASGAIHANGSIDTDTNLTVDGTSTLTGTVTANTITTTTSGIEYKGTRTGIQNVSSSGSQSEFDTAVSFGVTFGATPRVYLTKQGAVSNSAKYQPAAVSVTTTGFTLRMNSGDGTANTVTTLPVAWIAVSQ